MNLLRSTDRAMTRGEQIEMACMLSAYALLIGYMAAFKWNVPALYVISLIPAALSTLAAHYYDWTRDV